MTPRKPPAGPLYDVKVSHAEALLITRMMTAAAEGRLDELELTSRERDVARLFVGGQR